MSASKAEFEAFLALARNSIADPTWFAIPLSCTEDSVSYTLIFDLTGRREKDISVEGGERSIVVFGSKRPGRGRETRLLVLPENIKPESVEALRRGAILEVRVEKLRHGVASPSTAST
jgi:HSP20 family molecular chaperone IbpA